MTMREKPSDTFQAVILGKIFFNIEIYKKKYENFKEQQIFYTTNI